MGKHEPPVDIRPATEDDHMAVRRIMDSALLIVEELPERLADGDVLVAVPAGEGGSILGAVVLVPSSDESSDDSTEAEAADNADTHASTDAADNADTHASTDAADDVDGTVPTDIVEIEAIAVRRARRGQRIGTALVEAVAERYDVVVAEFDADLRPFYEALGFEIRTIGEERLRGRLEGDDRARQ